MDYFEVATIPGRGQGLLATRDIDPGCVVYTEEALIVAPGTREACVECLFVEDESVRKSGETGSSCRKCGHMLCQKCSSKSEADLIWHTRPECEVLHMLDQDPATVFNFIFPLRLAILRKNDRESYDKVMLLENHLEERLKQNGPVKNSIVLMGKLLSSLFSDLDLEEAERMVATLLTNSFEMKVSQISGRAFYPVISRLNHSCIPNLSHANVLDFNDPDHNNSNSSSSNNNNDEENERSRKKVARYYMKLISQLRIVKGQELTIRYVSVMEGFVARQRSFLQDWFFICGCCRCRDPSEFGTNLSSVKCGVCSKGFVIPPPPTLAGANEETSNFNQKIRLVYPYHFTCSSCHAECDFNFVWPMEEDISHHIQKDEPCIEQLQELLEACLPVLHDEHYLIVMLKEAIIYKPSQDFKMLKHQESHTRHLLQFIETIEPGQTWKKFQFLAKLKGILLNQAKVRSEEEESDVEFLRNRLIEIESLTSALKNSKYNSFYA